MFSYVFGFLRVFRLPGTVEWSLFDVVSSCDC